MKGYKTVEGMVVTPLGMRKTTLTVRVSDDELGQTISISDEDAGCMMAVPIEPLKNLIKVVR